VSRSYSLGGSSDAVVRRQQCGDLLPFPGEIPGGSTTLFDYFWDIDSCKWIPWTDKVPEYVHTSDRKFHKILVPTVDTVRTTWLLSLHVRSLHSFRCLSTCRIAA